MNRPEKLNALNDDMTAVILGPYATQIMGDLGAEIIKVEPPKGDVLRWNGSRLRKSGARPPGSASTAGRY